MPGVVAWRPILLPYGEERIPKRRKQAGPGDRIGSARVEADGKMLLHLEIRGGDRLEDSLHVNDFRSAVDSLFDALFPLYLDDFEICLFEPV